MLFAIPKACDIGMPPFGLSCRFLPEVQMTLARNFEVVVDLEGRETNACWGLSVIPVVLAPCLLLQPLSSLSLEVLPVPVQSPGRVSEGKQTH